MLEQADLHARGDGPWLLRALSGHGPPKDGAVLCGGGGRSGGGAVFNAFGKTPNSREEVRLRGLSLEEKPLKQLQPSPPGPHLAKSPQRVGGL